MGTAATRPKADSVDETDHSPNPADSSHSLRVERSCRQTRRRTPIPPPAANTRLSAVCDYQDVVSRPSGVWFPQPRALQDTTLTDAHRWGYGRVRPLGASIFREWKRRFVVLLGRCVCILDGHEPDSRVKGGIDIAADVCNVRLPPESEGDASCLELAPIPQDGARSSGGSSSRAGVGFLVSFDSSDDLQAWMKAIFEVRHRAATLRPALPDAFEARLLSHEPLELHEVASFISGHSGVEFGATVTVSTLLAAARAPSHGSTEPELPPVPPSPRLPLSPARKDVGQQEQKSSSKLEGRKRRQYRGREKGSSGSGSSAITVVAQTSPAPAKPGPEEQEEEALAAAAVGPEGCSHAEYQTIAGDRYVGSVRRLQRHGAGILYRADGDIIAAEAWEQDVLNGAGRWVRRSGSGSDLGVLIYEGEFVKGERQGLGRLLLPNGDSWRCRWAAGSVVAGMALLVTAAGDVYSGGCAPSAADASVPCCSGHGRLRRASGDQYEANFCDGRVKEGSKAVLRYRNGAIYFGQFSDDMPQGYGEVYLTRSNGCSCGVPELDVLAEDVVWYKGQFHAGLPHGDGLVKWRDRAVSSCSSAGGVKATSSSSSVTGASVKGRHNAVASGNVGNLSTAGGEIERKELKEVGRLAVRAGFQNPLIDGGSFEDDDESDSDEEIEDAATADEICGQTQGADAAAGGTDASARQLVSGEEISQSVQALGEQRQRRGDSLRRPTASSNDSSLPDLLEESEWEYEYEARFVRGVLQRDDPSNMRLVALKFGRAELRRLLKQQQQQEEALHRLRSHALCLVCNVSEMNALLVGCSHRVMCMGCAKAATDCPLCGRPVGVKIVRTYSA